jgi:hypothetical protein
MMPWTGFFACGCHVGAKDRQGICAASMHEVVDMLGKQEKRA